MGQQVTWGKFQAFVALAAAAGMLALALTLPAPKYPSATPTDLGLRPGYDTGDR